MKREEILSQFKVDEHGIIRDPGKFEGEMIYSPYFYDLCMDGACDQEDYDGDTLLSYFDISAEDIKEFPELEEIKRIVCWESDQGFWNLRKHNAAK